MIGLPRLILLPGFYLFLTPVQKGKFNAFWTVAFQNYQQFFFQIRAGTYDSNLLDGWWQVLRDDFLSPGLQAFWEKRKFILTPEFRNFVVRGSNDASTYSWLCRSPCKEEEH